MLCYSFYLVGKNLLYILNNIWHAHHVNRNTLRYLSLFKQHRNKLILQSYGYYNNITSMIHKNNIVFTEVLALSTICLAEYKTKISIFFIWLQTSVLFFFMGLSIVALKSYKFTHVKQIIKMAEVFDTGFCYYYVMVFIFLFYQFFMMEEVTILQRGELNVQSSFTFCYIMAGVYIVIYEVYHLLFVLNYQEKKSRRFELIQNY